MSTPSTYFPLCGDDLPSWAIDFKKLPQSRYRKDSSSILGQAAWPLVLFSQCPVSWLDADPGFPILLRDVVESTALKPWLVGSRDYELRFSTKQTNPGRLLCIVHHDPDNVKEKYHNLQRTYPNAEILWTQYACKKLPPLPTEKYIDMNVLLMQAAFVPDIVFDFNFYKHDTYSPAHLFCVHQGATIMNTTNTINQERKIKFSRKTWYGEWVIFESAAQPS